jgi:HNH endonuclease
MSNKKEIWKTITVEGKKPSIPYAVSNHGRFGVMNGSKVEVRTFKPTAGVYRYNTRQNGKNKAIFVYKEVAKAFLPKPSPKHKFIIHKDHNYLNDHPSNLVWATKAEHRAHTTYSPANVAYREKKAITKSKHSQVFTEKSIKELKTKIWDPKRKLSFKKLAEMYGVSEMQIYRIKSGTYWYHVKVDNEPIHPKYKRNLSNIAYQEKIAAQAAKRKSSAKKKKSAKKK